MASANLEAVQQAGHMALPPEGRVEPQAGELPSLEVGAGRRRAVELRARALRVESRPFSPEALDSPRPGRCIPAGGPPQLAGQTRMD